MERKIRRRRDDHNLFRPEIPKNKFHMLCNQQIDTFLRDAYSAKIKQFLLERTQNRLLSVLNQESTRN